MRRVFFMVLGSIPGGRDVKAKTTIKNLVLLPGMDGTGELFDDFIAVLPSTVRATVGSYPRAEFLDYRELLEVVGKILPNEPFVLLAESFSTPLAVMLAARSPKFLAGVILCAGFVMSPFGPRSVIAKAFARPTVFRLPPPEVVLKRFLLTPQASDVKTRKLKNTIRGVSPEVLSRRAQMILSCDVRPELARVKVPLLYLQGSRDTMVGKKSFQEIRRVKPDAQLAVVDAPHLILQSEPRVAAERIMEFVEGLKN
jgi:pimeloyl-ACP methyl ester carboxylesterase